MAFFHVQMEKKKFSKLETVLIVLFCLVVAVVAVLIGVLATRDTGPQSPRECWVLLLNRGKKKALS